MLLLRLTKLFHALRSARFRSALLRHGVLAATEHNPAIAGEYGTLIDVGANVGQFSLAFREMHRAAQIHAFEPLEFAARVYREVFIGDQRTNLFQVALGSTPGNTKINVSARPDSSSILPISAIQAVNFPGTEHSHVQDITVVRLSDTLVNQILCGPVFMKIDVQGFELEALKGAEAVLPQIDSIYCECSFAELYSGQPAAAEVIAYLAERDFGLVGVYNNAYDKKKASIQADFLFRRRTT
jgi:FkbM family methyltransferase